MKKSLWSIQLTICYLLVSCNSFQNTPPEGLSTSVSNESKEEDIDLALESLDNFFNYLSIGEYDEAAQLFGGSYESMINNNPDLDPSDYAGLMERACLVNGVKCIQLRTASFSREHSSANEFVFLVKFNNPDGSLFELGPCCGANATDEPPVSEFEYTVIKTTDGEFLVMEMPPYIP